MDERKRRILHAIIQDYVRTAEPVASRAIARHHALGISAATVRNEMMDLEELGYLEQPHSSSGRIPSARGYRYYVDTILHQERLAYEDMQLLSTLWMEQQGDFTDFIQQTAKRISQVSHNMSVVLGPQRDQARIRYLHVLPSGERRAIIVLVTDGGALDNEPIFFNHHTTDVMLEEAAVTLQRLLYNIPLCDLTDAKWKALLGAQEGLDSVTLVLVKGIRNAIAKRKMFYAVGTPELLEQPEFRQTSMVQPILNLLEEQDEWSRLLVQEPGKAITIRIGRENADAKMHNCSIIQADFSVENEHLGTLAILGPTRMEYGRLVGMLRYLQQLLESVAHDRDIQK